MDIRSALKEGVLLFDGAMGSYFSTMNEDPMYPCELANVTNPQKILAIHEEYLNAGARAIKTNTFSLPWEGGSSHSVEEVVRSGYRLAKEAAMPYGAYVFADVSTQVQTGEEDLFPRFRSVVDIFLEEGAKHFLFETCPSGAYLTELGRYIKEREPDAFLVASFGVSAQGYSKTGAYGPHLVESLSDDFDAVGYNCVVGPYHMAELVEGLDTKKYISAMPNASYPTVAGSQLRFGQNSGYYAEQMMEVAKAGGRLLGGCCGTTPACIEQLAEKLKDWNGEQRAEGLGLPPVLQTGKQEKQGQEEEKEVRKSDFYEKLKLGQRTGKKPIAVEWDSPAEPEIAEYMAKARKLKDVGVDLITIADCPVARPRIDSSLVACKLKRELGMHAMPHMTCRDRNINAAKALLMGLSVEEINNVLIITGDPIPQEQRAEIKTVYEFNSRKLIKHIRTLNESLFTSPFYLYGALNVNAVNFAVQIRMAKEKVENGAVAFFTQPVLSARGLENMKRAKEELGVPLVGGLYPPVSLRNINFLTNEISGFHVDPEIATMYEGKTAEECEEVAVRVVRGIAKEVAPYIDGYYLITPFKRVELMLEIIKDLPRG